MRIDRTPDEVPDVLRRETDAEALESIEDLQRARDILECASIVGLPPPSNRAEAFADTVLFGDDEAFARAMDALPQPEPQNMSNIREQLKARAAGMVREEEFEVDGVKMLAIGLMTGGKNLLMSKAANAEGVVNVAKFTPLVIAHCIHDPVTRKQLWNPNDLNDLTELDGFPSETTDPMVAAASRVNGWGKDAVELGKSDSKIQITSSDSSSPDALAAA